MFMWLILIYSKREETHACFKRFSNFFFNLNLFCKKTSDFGSKHDKCLSLFSFGKNNLISRGITFIVEWRRRICNLVNKLTLTSALWKCLINQIFTLRIIFLHICNSIDDKQMFRLGCLSVSYSYKISDIKDF